MYSNKREAQKKLKTLVISPKKLVDYFRRDLEHRFASRLLPNAVEKKELDYGGIACDLLVPEIFSSDKIILYVHGGSFVGGTRDSWRNFCASLANAASCRLVLPEFRLAPTYQFPASLEDVQAVFKQVYIQNSGKIILAADGSGASILLAMLFGMSDVFKQAISCVVLFSPWLDFSAPKTTDGKKHKKSALEKADKILSLDILKYSSDLYTYEANKESLLVSPLKGEVKDFKGFPPVFIQMGENELLVEQAKVLQQKILDAGSECILEIWPNQMHLFQMADEFLADSHLAMEKVGHLIQEGFPIGKKEDL